MGTTQAPYGRIISWLIVVIAAIAAPMPAVRFGGVIALIAVALTACAPPTQGPGSAPGLTASVVVAINSEVCP